MPLPTVMNGKPRGPMIDAAVEWLKKNKTEGDDVSHDELADRLGEIPGSARYYGMAHSVRRKLLEHTGFYLRAIPGVGYRLCIGREQMDQGVGQVRRATRKMMRGAIVIAAVTDDRLSTEDRDRRDFAVGQFKTLVEMARLESKKVQLVLGKSAPLPQ